MRGIWNESRVTKDARLRDRGIHTYIHIYCIYIHIHIDVYVYILSDPLKGQVDTFHLF